jgi:plastocyanin
MGRCATLAGCAVCLVCILAEAAIAVAMASTSGHAQAGSRAFAAGGAIAANDVPAASGCQTHRTDTGVRTGTHMRTRTGKDAGKTTGKTRRCCADARSRKRCPRRRERSPGTGAGTHALTGSPGVGSRTGAAGGSMAGGAEGTGGTRGTGGAGASPGAPAGAPSESDAPGEPGGSAPGESGGAPSESSPPSGPTHVQVTAEDTDGYRFILSRTTVPAGEVVIEFVNHGQDEHNLHAVESTAGAEAGSLPNTAPGAHPQLKLDLRSGSYTLFCSLPGHEAKGMKATLTVQ